MGAGGNQRKLFLSVDERNRWRVFDAADALGEFATWDEANALKQSLTSGEDQETGPAWTPKSGGY